jgi:predicted TIM-barrel enzyme
LGDEDATETAELLEPGTMAAVIVYENAWAIPFVAAAREAGGELIAKLQVTAQDIMDTLDALEGSN